MSSAGKSVSGVSVYVSNAEYIERRSAVNGLTSAIERIVTQARQFIWIAVPWFYTSTADAWIGSLVDSLAARRNRPGVLSLSYPLLFADQKKAV